MALSGLLATCSERDHVWLWHNGEDQATLDVVNEFCDHPRVARFHHSVKNQRVAVPTAWLMQESDASYLSKVDDDCLVPEGWIDRLVAAHESEPRFGILGCWRFPESMFDEPVASRKIVTYGEHRIMANCWVEGSGFLMKRDCINDLGPIGESESFPTYCMRAALKGWINGWYFPFLFQEHFDHPWSEHTVFTSDEAFRTNLPLMAHRRGITDLKGYAAHFEKEAAYLQSANPNPKAYAGWRGLLRSIDARVKRLVTRYRHRGME